MRWALFGADKIRNLKSSAMPDTVNVSCTFVKWRCSICHREQYKNNERSVSFNWNFLKRAELILVRQNTLAAVYFLFKNTTNLWQCLVVLLYIGRILSPNLVLVSIRIYGDFCGFPHLFTRIFWCYMNTFKQFSSIILKLSITWHYPLDPPHITTLQKIYALSGK